MTFGEAIYGALVADPTVAGLAATRIYPNVAPQGVVTPAIVYSVVSDTPENSLTGASPTRLSNARLQVDCYAKTYLGAQGLADAVDAVASALATSDLSAWRLSRNDLYENETQLHRVTMDFGVWK